MDNINKPNSLDWVKINEDGNYFRRETTWQKMVRKFRENPFVPIGGTVTVGALTYGLYNFYYGHHQKQQNMMRLRVGAQLFTILAILIGSILKLPAEKRNYQGLLESGDLSVKMSKQLMIIFFITLIAVALGCVCPRNYMPVCDNNGNQHNNLCLFDCAAKKALRNGKEIRIVKYGQC